MQFFLGLSLALRSHDQFQASHWSTLPSPPPKKKLESPPNGPPPQINCGPHNSSFFGGGEGIGPPPQKISISEFPSFQVSEFPSSKFQSFWVSEFPSVRVSKFPSFRVSEVPSYRVTELPSYRVSEFPSLQVSKGERDGGPMRGLKLIMWYQGQWEASEKTALMAQTHKQTSRHGDSMTNSAPLLVKTGLFVLRF